MLDGKVVTELPTMTCAHCHGCVVLNVQRTRPRGHCSKCGRYVCDTPACNTLECNNLSQLFDKIQEQAFRDLNIKEI